jgi:hypothetical protein
VALGQRRRRPPGVAVGLVVAAREVERQHPASPSWQRAMVAAVLLVGVPPGRHDVVLGVGGRPGDRARSFSEVLRGPIRPVAESFRDARRFL